MARYRGALIALLLQCAQEDPAVRCKSDYKANNWKAAIESCGEASTNKQDIDSALRLARVHFQLQQNDEALRIALSLFGTSADATAKQIAGSIYSNRKAYTKARPLLREAFALHRAAGEHSEAARDAHALAGSYRHENLFLEAIQALDDCLVEAEASAEPQMMGYAHMAMGQIMFELGDRQAAEWAYQKAAKELGESPYNQAWLTLELAMFALDKGQYLQAELLFRDALRFATQLNQMDILTGAKMNLAFILVQDGRVEEADELIKNIDEVADQKANTLLYTKAILAKERGDLAESAALLDRFAKNPPHQKWASKILYKQGSNAEEQGALAKAEGYYRSAIKVVEELRDDAGTAELRTWLLFERRESYEALFALLARQGRAQEALFILESLHARAFLDRFSARDPEPFDIQRSALQAASLREFLTQLRRSPMVSPASPEVLVERLAKLDILAYQEADEHLWAVRIEKGNVTIEDLGVAKEIYRAADDFAATPDDAALAEKVGALLIPDWKSSEAPLYLITNDRLARVPFAALQRSKRFLIEERPLIFAPSLSALVTPPSVFVGKPLVIGAPTEDLPAAKIEAEQIGRILGVEPLLGEFATQEKLTAAKGATLLHLATHVRIGATGGSILLADQELSAAEVVSLEINASVVVLAGCSSAASRDTEQWGSLAMAFLATGSSSVVASLRSVGDEETRQLFTLFYQHDWTAPATALAKAQRQLARKAPAEDWAFFAVYSAALPPKTAPF